MKYFKGYKPSWISKYFNLRKKETKFITDEKNIVGVTMNYAGKPCLCFKGGWILPSDVERMRFGKYFQHGDWPTYPDTGEKLPIAQ